MDWNHNTPHVRGLMALRAVAENGTFTRAARALGWNQPNVSKHLQTLEQALDRRLLRRDRAGTDLTADGARVLEHAVRITDACAELVDTLDSGHPTDPTDARPLRIAVSPTLGHHWLDRARSGLESACSERPIRTRVLRGRGALRYLARGQADLALVEHPPADSDLIGERVGTDRLVAACHPSHPWAAMDSVALSELLRARHVLREPGCDLREGLEQLLRQAGQPPITPDREVGSDLNLLDHLRQGEHLTVTSSLALDSDWGQGLTALPIRDIDLNRPLWAVRPPQARSRGDIAAVMDYLRTHPIGARPRAFAASTRKRETERHSLLE